MSIANSSTTYDFIIVGAGVSGLFNAWRLLNSNPDLNILIIEKLGRTGGRLQTTTVGIEYPADGQIYQVKDEEGGMRFNSDMYNLCRLIDVLKLTPVPFYMSYKNANTNRCYFRGNPFTIAETPGIWNAIYNLSRAEADKSPGDIILGVLQKILQQNPGQKFSGSDNIPLGPDEWQTFRNVCTYNGYVINQWGFWALMRTAGLTEECIDWLKNVIGFMGPTQACINAGESLQILLDFPGNEVFNTLREGFQSIPSALESIVRTQATVNLNETVTHIAENESGTLQITSNRNSYACRKLILAVPAEGLRKIIATSGLLQNAAGSFQYAVDSVKDMELTKVGLYFNERWWHSNPAINLTCGPSFNDLPLGTVYCFQQYPGEDGQDENYNGPAALTIYNDYDRGSFWKEMQNIGTPYLGVVAQPENTIAASTCLVDEALRQIKMLFNLQESDTIPMPVLTTYRVWGEGEFGYGYHQYKLNVNDTDEVYPCIYNPLPNVFICNESWSPEQGWIEGALIASELVLTQGLGLPPFIEKSNLPTKTPDYAGSNNKRPLGPANIF